MLCAELAKALLLNCSSLPVHAGCAVQVDSAAAGEYAELCVHLYADYCPARLMDFLQGSQTYPLESALEVAEQRGMVDEQVRPATDCSSLAHVSSHSQPHEREREGAALSL